MSTRKFHRISSRRRIFKKSLVTSLIDHKRIETTVTRAKEIRPLIEKFITTAKGGDLKSMRLLLARLPKHAANKLYYDIAPQYKDRHGGYTRITKQARFRKRDGVALAIIEFV